MPPKSAAKRSDQAHFKVTWVKYGTSKLTTKPDSKVEWGRYVSSTGPKNAARKAARNILSILDKIDKVSFELELINREVDNKYSSKRGTKFVYDASWSKTMIPARNIVSKGKVIGKISEMPGIDLKLVTKIKPEA